MFSFIALSLSFQIYRCSLKKQTGVSLKYMMAHGSCPSERNILQAAQFLQQELPIRLAHRVTELENLPFGLSTKAPVLKVRPGYEVHQESSSVIQNL